MRLVASPLRRRLCLGIATWPAASFAQAPAQRRVGFISGGSAGDAAGILTALRAELARRGYAQPESLVIDPRFAAGDLALIPSFVAEFERSGVALIVTHAVATTIVVKAARTVPVVYEFSADPVSAGVANDLGHPLFNATGITLMLAELNGKRLELLKEMVPGLQRVGVLANPLHPGQKLEHAVVDDKARHLGLRTTAYTTSTEPELDAALKAIAVAPPDGLLVLSDGFVVVHRRKILDFALERRLPVMSGWAVMAESGALCAYGPRISESYTRLGYFVDRVLKGVAPSTLPIEQPTVLELIVNLKTSRQLGLAVPRAVMARADRVIE